MSRTDFETPDVDPQRVRLKSNVYTALTILASVFLAGGITLLYLTIEPYTYPPRHVTPAPAFTPADDADDEADEADADAGEKADADADADADAGGGPGGPGGNE